MTQPDSRQVAQEILEIFRQPHIDAGTELEDIHLLEQIADVIEEYEKDLENLFKRREDFKERLGEAL